MESELDPTVAEAEPAQPPSSAGQGAPIGTALGRYVLMERVGAGGMGLVYSAYDPQLDRQVALKVLRASEREDPETAVRLLREAKALARLSHPNVVPIYDVGAVGGRVFIAMELVSGRTLSEWLKHKPRGWREVVDVFLDAGEGLAAAHATGLVHRDFKPHNVLVGDDGRVRVADFGLAVDAGSATAAESPGDRPPQNLPSDSRLTAAGTVIGTPRYMAPEQFLGASVDALTDQFSFCVALYSAVFGVWPFRLDDETIGEAVQRGELRETPEGVRVSARLLRILTRGLSVDRTHRWPSMQVVLDELRATRHAARRRWLAAGVAIVAIYGGITVLDGGETASTCMGSSSRLDGVWDVSRRSDLRAAFSGVGVRFGRDSTDHVVRQLDSHAAAWAAMHSEACEATHVSGHQPTQVLDMRMQCLDVRRREIGALVDVFLAADSQVVQQSVQAVSTLTPIAHCGDMDLLARKVAPPSDPEVARTVEEIRRLLVEARALEATGRFTRALQLAQRVAQDADRTTYAPVIVEAQYRLGSLLAAAARLPEAETAFKRAALEGIAVKHDEIAVEATARLVGVVGFRQDRPQEGMDWARHCESILERLPPDHPTEALLLNNVALMLKGNGWRDEAVAPMERALEIRLRLYGEHSPGTALGLNNLAILLQGVGRLEEAIDHHMRALAIWDQTLGLQHPHTLAAFDSLGQIHNQLGHYETAMAFHERALWVAERAFSPRSGLVGSLLANVANNYYIAGEYEAASSGYLRAAKLLTLPGPPHRALGIVLANLGASELMAERPRSARRYFERARELNRRVHGPRHPSVAGAIGGEGEAALAAGDLDTARRLIERALAMAEPRVGPESLVLVTQIQRLAELRHAQGDLPAARAAWERVAVLASRMNPEDHPARALHEFEIARKLWTMGRPSDRRRARSLAQGAERQLEEALEPPEGSLDEVRAWLAAHAVD